MEKASSNTDQIKSAGDLHHPLSVTEEAASGPLLKPKGERNAPAGYCIQVASSFMSSFLQVCVIPKRSFLSFVVLGS
jgi:hypothetical protein